LTAGNTTLHTIPEGRKEGGGRRGEGGRWEEGGKEEGGGEEEGKMIGGK